jgi:hypothetical protein
MKFKNVIVWLLALSVSGCTHKTITKAEQNNPVILTENRVEQPRLRLRKLASRRTILEKHVLIEPGDSLWAIAGKLYGNHFLWPLLCHLNNLDCDLIEPGQVLKYFDQSAPIFQKKTTIRAILKEAYETPAYRRRKSLLHAQGLNFGLYLSMGDINCWTMDYIKPELY